ncbi:MAG: hypothetical protein KDE31_31750, partial [Caldilineaceae bacterium]|nr:hypothetical protein [Caldilineaceae bacterium]
DSSDSTDLALEPDGTQSMALSKVEPTASVGTIQLMSEASEASVHGNIESPSLSAMEEADESDLQPVPLQEIWPGVQQVPHMESSADKYEQDEMVGAAKSEPSDVIVYTDRTEVSNSVQRALQQVETAHPTESAVHVIPPRRPRPRSQQRPLGKQPTPTGKRDPPSIPTNYQADEQVHEEQDSSVMPALNTDGDLSEGVVQPALVETEIGALPADLWRLIDEPLPKQTAKAAAPANSAQPTVMPTSSMVQTKQATSQPSTGTDKLDAIQIDVPDVANGVADENPEEKEMLPSVVDVVSRDADSVYSTAPQSDTVGKLESVDRQKAGIDLNGIQIPVAVGPTAISRPPTRAIQTSAAKANDIASPSPSSVKTITEPTNGLVQRQPDEVPSEPMIEDAMPQVDGASENESASTNKVDTDELAREVYSKLRRRLVIEGERLGR